jgi:hypothetical protein
MRGGGGEVPGGSRASRLRTLRVACTAGSMDTIKQINSGYSAGAELQHTREYINA